MDVTTYLESDHKKVLGLLTKLKKTASSDMQGREQQFELIKEELYLHEQAEQQVLYPALMKKAKSSILEAYQEHHVVNLLLDDIESVSFDDESFKAKITVLLENLKHHIKEERETIFPLTRKHYKKAERENMVKEMRKIKKSLK